jgi:hypothetical protein
MRTKNLLIKMLYVQQTDNIAYNSVNFDDTISTLSYIIKLYQSLAPSMNPERVEQFFNGLMDQIIKKGTMKGSNKSAEAEAQDIMRLVAEKIHGVFQELNRDSIVIDAEFVRDLMLEALRILIDLSNDDNDDEDVSKLLGIRNHIEKDAKVLKDYEVLG